MPSRLLSRRWSRSVGIEDVLDRLRSDYADDDLDLVQRAHAFAEAAHRGQRRRSGESYVSHPVAVALVLAELHLDPVTVAVALLHDVLEDTETTAEELSERFGDEVATLVEGVTKIGQMEFSSRVEEQAVNIRKLLLAMVDDVRVLLVKLGDRLHNMRTLEHLRREARLRIARETVEIYAPLAHRLGMGRIQRELEDLSFRHLEPEAYGELDRNVAHRLRAARRQTRRIESLIQREMRDHEIACQVEHRVKGLHSLHRKMSSRELDLEQVYDLIAFRIITDTVRNCYAALGIIHNHWSPVPGRFKDFIAMPKRNMYQSLHTTLMDSGKPFEVQIRTEEMHRVAEEGIAAHWLYKEGERYEDEEAQPLAWLRQLVEWQREVSDPREFLSSLKLNLYPDEVYVFTPQGDVKSLPRKATPLDFAYLIHTEVGHRCAGAKVNGKLVPLRQELRNGDIVEIVTNPDATPSRDWLRIVQTSRARSKIRAFLNKQERERALDLGKRMLDKELRKSGARLSRLLNDGVVEEVAGQFGLGKAEDLLVAVSFGKVSVRSLVEKLLPDEEGDEASRPSAFRRLVDRAISWTSDQAIQVKGMDGVMVYRARCCGPVPGEPIVGYVTRGKGVSVHSRTCGNLERLLLDEDRKIDVEWTSAPGVTQPVRLRIGVDDRQGLLAALTARIAEEGSNIRHIESKMGKFRGLLEVILDVEDRAHLRRIIRAIDTIEGVRHVRRGRAPG